MPHTPGSDKILGSGSGPAAEFLARGVLQGNRERPSSVIVENAGGFDKGHKHWGQSFYGGQGESDGGGTTAEGRAERATPRSEKN